MQQKVNWNMVCKRFITTWIYAYMQFDGYLWYKKQKAITLICLVIFFLIVKGRNLHGGSGLQSLSHVICIRSCRISNLRYNELLWLKRRFVTNIRYELRYGYLISTLMTA